MTTRQERRAAERAARKQSRKAGSSPETDNNAIGESSTSAAVFAGPQPEVPATAPVPPPVSERRAEANRVNAQLSTGPKTIEGKTASSKNAVKTALTGRTVLLPADDADRYERLLLAYKESFRPSGQRECELVQALADAAWRLDRIPGLEEAIYCKGAAEFAGQVAELSGESRSAMLRMHTALAYERPLRNLHTQEMRLHRLREKLQVELKQLQAERQQAHRLALDSAAKLLWVAKHEGRTFNPADHGFVFSTAELEAYLADIKSQPKSLLGYPPNFKARHSSAA